MAVRVAPVFAWLPVLLAVGGVKTYVTNAAVSPQCCPTALWLLKLTYAEESGIYRHLLKTGAMAGTSPLHDAFSCH